MFFVDVDRWEHSRAKCFDCSDVARDATPGEVTKHVRETGHQAHIVKIQEVFYESREGVAE